MQPHTGCRKPNSTDATEQPCGAESLRTFVLYATQSPGARPVADRHTTPNLTQMRPVIVRTIGMADGRRHDLNADERMRPTAHCGASAPRPVCCGREGHHNVQVDFSAGRSVGQPTWDRARSERARGAVPLLPRGSDRLKPLAGDLV